jgi:hypothetical protein
MRALAAVGLALLLAACAAASAAAYGFGPVARQAGPEQIVLDWSTQRCDFDDYADAPARAFRDAAGQTQLVAGAPVNRRMRGPGLDALTRDCSAILTSRLSPDPAAYAAKQWLASFWTRDGTTIDALVHDEFHGMTTPIGCLSLTGAAGCWYNAVTAARSVDGGATYSAAPAPASVVATSPFRYIDATGPYGVFEPSNIIRARRPGEGVTYFYALVHVEDYPRAKPVQRAGVCLMRTRDLAAPATWRAWGGEAFDVRFSDPYSESPTPSAHACRPVAFGAIEKMNSSLTYNWYLKKYLLVGMSSVYDKVQHRAVYGFYSSTSKDLVDWTPRRLLMEAPLPWTCPTGGEHQLAYPSLLDPASPSRNYETTGQHPYLYFTRLNDPCLLPIGADRDLVRIPIELVK